MKLFSNCSGSCDRCKIYYTGGCLAGHGDDDFTYASDEWIKDYKIKNEIKTYCYV